MPIGLNAYKCDYALLEAGCTLVRNPRHLTDAFSHHPDYYHFDEEADAAINYHEFGLQNSRGFRALKVWLALRQAGRSGYVHMLAEDIGLSQELFELADAHPELESVTNRLSMITFRFIPEGLDGGSDYLNELNSRIVERLQNSSDAFVSNALIDGKQLVRACIVNFRTTRDDIRALPEIVARIGRELDSQRRVAAN